MISLFFSHITNAIIDSILLFTIMWIVYDIIKWLVHLTANNKYLLTIFFQIFGTIVFWMQLIYGNTYSFIQYLQINFAFKRLTISLPINNFNLIVAYIYTVVVLVFLIQSIIALISLRKLTRQSDFSNSNKYEKLLIELSDTIHSKIKFGTNNNITSPIVYGFVENIILLPAALCNYITPSDLKYILLHEWAHILRKDYLINLSIELTTIMLWFNPLVYLFRNEMNLQREIACDEYVNAKMNDPIGYSKTLLKIAESATNTNNYFSLAAFSNHEDLKIRIQHINGISRNINNKFVYLFGLFIIGILFFINTATTNNIVVKLDNKLSYRQNTNTSLTYIPLYTKKKLIIKNRNRADQHVFSHTILSNKDSLKNEHEIAYSELVDQTKAWIKKHENPLYYANYIDESIYDQTKDATEDALTNKLLIFSIVKSYQLKKAILEDKIKNAANQKEVIDYIFNSNELNEILQYEKWAHEFLKDNKTNYLFDNK